MGAFPCYMTASEEANAVLGIPSSIYLERWFFWYRPL